MDSPQKRHRLNFSHKKSDDVTSYTCIMDILVGETYLKFFGWACLFLSELSIEITNTVLESEFYAWCFCEHYSKAHVLLASANTFVQRDSDYGLAISKGSVRLCAFPDLGHLRTVASRVRCFKYALDDGQSLKEEGFELVPAVSDASWASHSENSSASRV